MIDTELVRNLLSKKFGERNLSAVRPGIFRAESRFQDKTYEIHYFDTTEPFASPAFNLRDYQSALLAGDYYSHPGSLQWNYYLNFVVEDADIGKPAIATLSADIIEDRSLARKSITPLSVLEGLPGSLASTAVAPPDVRDIWRAQLSPAGLDEALDTSLALDSVVERYLTSGTAPKSSSKTPLVNPVEDLPPLAEMRLRTFREYPAQREFQFGQVNLIHGPNGSGKTSLLEAIELWICGSTARNKQKKEVFELDIKPRGTQEFHTVAPLEEKVYRDRDSAWYNHSYLRGNDVCESFARFNFFDCDGASRFAGELESNGLVDALKPIVFGVEAPALERRLVGLRDRFAAEAKRTHELRVALELDVMLEEQRAKELRQYDVGAIATDALEERVKQILRNGDATRTGIADLAALITTIDLSLTEITSLDASAAHTARDLQAQKTSAVSTKDELVSLETLRLELGRQRQAFESERKALGDTKFRLNRLTEYVDAEALLPLDEAEFARLRSLAASASQLRTQLTSETLSAWRTSNESYVQIKDRLQTSIHSASSRSSEISKLISDLETTSSRRNLLQQQLRQVANDLLALAPDAKACPLCGQSHADLHATIDMTQSSDAVDSEELAVLLNERATLDTQVAEHRTTLERLDKTFACARSLVDSSGVEARPLSHVWSDVTAGLTKLAQAGAQLLEIEERRSSLLARGFNTEEALALMRALDLTAAPTRDLRSIVAQRTRDNRLRLDQVISELTEISQKQESLEQRSRRLLETNGVDDDVTQPIQALTLRIERLDNNLGKLRELREIVEVAEDQDLLQFHAQVKDLASLVARNLDVERRQTDLAQTDARLAKLRENRALASRRAEAASHAERTLRSLIDDSGLDKRVEFFLRDNSTSVRRIFLSIHAPKEFSNLELTSQGLRIFRAGHPIHVGTTELSTGQRSALALSVFLTMNSLLRRGPDLLIFDDPIVYVDDLNVLSFLDFLKSIAMSRRRQIFFATANTRIADLFTRKFDFLGKDFVNIPLKRVEASKSSVH